MRKTTHSWLTILAGLGLLAAPALLVLAQEGPIITGPTIVAPTVVAPTSAPAATAPAAPAGTQSAEAILENEATLKNLLHSPPTASVVKPLSGSPVATPAVAGVAPAQPEVKRLTERSMIYSRVGRLVRDEKTGQWMFAFESDGKEMKDPPMGLVPSRMLEAMEEASDKGAKSIKFRVTGMVMEYRGKNYLWVQVVQQVKDMNQF